MNGVIYIFMGTKSLVREQVDVGVSDFIRGVSSLNLFQETMFSGHICLVILVPPPSAWIVPQISHRRFLPDPL
jgi:hypothetical protein